MKFTTMQRWINNINKVLTDDVIQGLLFAVCLVAWVVML